MMSIDASIDGLLTWLSAWIKLKIPDKQTIVYTLLHDDCNGVVSCATK